MNDPHQSLGASLLALHAALAERSPAGERLRCEVKHEPVGARMAAPGGGGRPEAASDVR
jgi:hypothetical protein